MPPRLLARLVTLLLAALVLSHATYSQEEAVDMQKAREIFQRAQRGESVTPEERAYVDRAQRQMRQTPGQNQGGQAQGGSRPGQGRDVWTTPPEPWTQHLTPLTELGKETYKGETGGLYGEGQNTPPPVLLTAASRAAALVKPLDTDGKPSPSGKIGFMSVGMSNTTQEFSAWVRQCRNDKSLSPDLTLVDGAQGARTSIIWANPDADVWPVVDQRLQAAGVSHAQVQVAWVKLAEGTPAARGEFPKHAKMLQENIGKTIKNLSARFPNLRLVYLSSRIYAGYANTPLNPEPYAYESAFSVRWLILDQLSSNGLDPKTPVLLWGPYLWADGKTPREADGVTYTRADLDRDGTHPSDIGRVKVADQLSAFFRNDPTTKPWFLRNP